MTILDDIEQFGTIQIIDKEEGDYRIIVDDDKTKDKVEAIFKKDNIIYETEYSKKYDNFDIFFNIYLKQEIKQ